MGTFRKHLDMAREKLESVKEAYGRRRHTVVGDLATKVVEQLVEADAARADRHLGSHQDRHEYSNQCFPEDMNKAMQRIWFAYGDLGYDGSNGRRAKLVMENLQRVVEFFEDRFHETIA